MVSKLFGFWTERIRRARLKRYIHEVKLLSDTRQTLETLPIALSEFWRLVQVADFENITPKTAMAVNLHIGHKNLPELIDFITEFNDHIANGRDGQIELLVKNEFIAKRTVVLDLYLSDTKQMPIDIRQMLVKLQGALMHHRYLLELQDNQYYQRMAERLYNEILTVTSVLVETINEETSL